MSPLRTGFFYGVIAVVVAFAGDLYFLFVDPATTPGWVLAVFLQYHTQLALAAYLFLGILAALQMSPVRTDFEVPYRSLLFRDGALAATVVALMVAAALFITTAAQATVFADALRDYSQKAAPKIVSYVNEARQELREPPPPARVEEVRASLQPPELRDLGRSIANAVSRAILLGAVGGLVGALRGRASSGMPDSPAPSGNSRTKK